MAQITCLDTCFFSVDRSPYWPTVYAYKHFNKESVRRLSGYLKGCTLSEHTATDQCGGQCTYYEPARQHKSTSSELY